MSASLSSSRLSYSSRYPLTGVPRAPPPPLRLLLYTSLPPRSRFSSVETRGGPRTFVNRRPSRDRVEEGRSAREGKDGKRKRGWASVDGGVEAKDRMSEDSVMRSLNTNAARGCEEARRGGGGKVSKEDRARRRGRRKARRKRSRSEETRRRGSAEMASGLMDPWGWEDSPARKELAIGPSHRRFVSCHARILECSTPRPLRRYPAPRRTRE